MFGIAAIQIAILSVGQTAVSLAPADYSQVSLLVGSPAEIDAERRICQALAKTISVDFKQTPLDEAMAAIQGQLGVNCLLDTTALEDCTVLRDTPITFKASGLGAKSALNALVRSLGLTWIVHNEALLITSPEAAGNHYCQIRVYPIRDLVTEQVEGQTFEDYDSLIDTVTTSVSATNWDEVGGRGSVSYSCNAGALVISQTRDVHEQIADLLTQLRAARRLQPAARGKYSSRASRRLENGGDPGNWPMGARAGGFFSVDPANAPAEEPSWRIPRVYR